MARTHGPRHSIPMFKSQVRRPLGYPGAPDQFYLNFDKIVYSNLCRSTHSLDPFQVRAFLQKLGCFSLLSHLFYSVKQPLRTQCPNDNYSEIKKLPKKVKLGSICSHWRQKKRHSSFFEIFVGQCFAKKTTDFLFNLWEQNSVLKFFFTKVCLQSYLPTYLGSSHTFLSLSFTLSKVI